MGFDCSAFATASVYGWPISSCFTNWASFSQVAGSARAAWSPANARRHARENFMVIKGLIWMIEVWVNPSQ